MGFGYCLIHSSRNEELAPHMCDTLTDAASLHSSRGSWTHINGKSTTYAYDSLNRLSSKTPDANFSSSATLFTYTASGKRLSMTDPSGSTAYTYNNRDSLLTKATPQGMLTYTYFPNGMVASAVSSNANGMNVSYAYDEGNRLTTVTDHRLANATTYTYDSANNVATVAYPNGVQSAFTYDTVNRLTAMNGYSYTLAPTGHRTGATEPNGRTLTWTYDNTNRLTKETIAGATPAGSVTYGLDAVGNRLSQTSTLTGISTGSFTYNANDRLSTETYDANGNTLVTGARAFTYDFEDRLVSMNSGAVTITYDGDGNRVAKTVGGVTTRYLVDDLTPAGYAQVVEELTSGAVTRRYTYGLQRISQDQLISGTWTPSYYGYDGFGSVRQLTNSAGTVADTYDHDAWGNAINVTGSTPNVYLYRGEQYDSDLSLYYLRARYYNPMTGRFLTLDPAEGVIGSPFSLHKYLYADGDSVNRVDPSGRGAIWERTIKIGKLLLKVAIHPRHHQFVEMGGLWCVHIMLLVHFGADQFHWKWQAPIPWLCGPTRQT
jgi:RHS repeat-associated protein